MGISQLPECGRFKGSWWPWILGSVGLDIALSPRHLIKYLANDLHSKLSSCLRVFAPGCDPNGRREWIKWGKRYSNVRSWIVKSGIGSNGKINRSKFWNDWNCESKGSCLTRVSWTAFWISCYKYPIHRISKWQILRLRKWCPLWKSYFSSHIALDHPIF